MNDQQKNNQQKTSIKPENEMEKKRKKKEWKDG